MPRLRSNFKEGTLSATAAVGATSLSSAAFQYLPTVASPDTLALILDPEGLVGDPEVVTVTAHTAAASTVTVTRGVESTVAREHLLGAAWMHGPTAVDHAQTKPVGDVVLAGDTAAQIQAKADGCATAGTTLAIPAGTWVTTAQTITFKCSVDADANAIFQSNATPVIQVALAGTTLYDAKIRLPQVERVTKNWGVAPGPGAGVINSDVGVQVGSLHTCELTITRVKNFSVGVLFAPSTRNVSNKISLGWLENNAVNVRLAPVSGGWVNENKFFGGTLSHNSGEGSVVAGTRHIDIPAFVAGAFQQNNNIFIGTNLEGDTPQYQVDCFGSDNLFLWDRWETTGVNPKIRWGVSGAAIANRNVVDGGYGAFNIEFTVNSGATHNRIANTSAGDKKSMSTTTGDVITNTGSSDNPVLSILDAGDSQFSATVAADYRHQIAANFLRAKAKADAHARVHIDFSNGRVYFGTGAASVTTMPFLVGLLGDLLLLQGNMRVYTAGKGLAVAEGTNCKQGVATLVAGTATVANTTVTTSSRIMLTSQVNGVTGALRVSARVAATSFTITSNNAGDAGDVAYQIFEPA